MIFRAFISLVFLILLQGCVRNIHTEPLDTPIERKKKVVTDYFTSIDSKIMAKLSASIGDEMFVMNRYLSAEEIVTIVPPTGKRFPRASIWKGTYKFNDGKSGDYIVYTSPGYYNEAIGVILDKGENLVTLKPLVQVKGSKAGRRWALKSGIPFFTIPQINIDSWALRYGGYNNMNYTFEIINKRESTTTDVLQTIYINDDKFKKGFIVRDVLITGISADQYGVIKYKIKDVKLNKRVN